MQSSHKYLDLDNRTMSIAKASMTFKNHRTRLSVLDDL